MFGKIIKNSIPIAIIIAGLLIGGVLIYINQSKCGVKTLEGPSAQQAAEKAISFINQNLLQQGTTASLVSAAEEDGVFKFKMKIGAQEYDSYITKDGKILFTSGINMEEQQATTTATTTAQQSPKTCEDLKKTEKPSMEAFVVSQCPYGLQMQRILSEVIKNIPSLAADIKVRYIGAIQGDKITSMHGDAEAQENLRQICIREEQSDKYWNYIACHIKTGDVDSCLASANVDTAKTNTCMTDKTKGLAYAKIDFDLQNKYSVSGSPTLFLNGEKVSEFDFGGRTAEALKTLLCCGFSSLPGTCSQKLTETSAATGFSESYAGSGGSSSSGGCAQ